MSLIRLCLRNLFFHRRGNFAVGLGVAIGTAVLTGALLVGDSLRGSLHDLTLRRLGWVDRALVAPRFFRQKLAEDLSSAADRIAPAIFLQATAVAGDRRARHVAVVGIEDHFSSGTTPGLPPAAGTVTLNAALAEALGVVPGSRLLQRGSAAVAATGIAIVGVRRTERVVLRIQKPSSVPRESLLGRKAAAELVNDWTLPVGAVLQPEDVEDPFSLHPGLDAPRTAFVRLTDLQARVDLPGRANVLLASGGDALPAQLRAALTLDDWGLRLLAPESRVAGLFAKLDRDRDGVLQPREWRGRLAESVVAAIHPKAGNLSRAAVLDYYKKHRNYQSLESSRLILEYRVGAAALEAAKEAGLRVAPTFVYLANSISDGAHAIPYSLVAAVPVGEVSPTEEAAPLGPTLPPEPAAPVEGGRIYLADWKDSPLHPEVGKPITLTYFAPEHEGEIEEKTATFIFGGFMPLRDEADDPDLTPEFPGITDKLSLSEWNPPFPFDSKRVKPADERWWKEHRTTPKAYIALKEGWNLWSSRFGHMTSVRVSLPTDSGTAPASNSFHAKLLEKLRPEDGGFVFDAVKQDALAASAAGTDFSILFLGFSFFLIAAALLLVGLLFRLNLDRRAAEIGLLLATGFRRAAVRRLLLGEGGLIALAGVAVGTGLAVAYAALLVYFLGAIWPDGALQSLLRPHVTAFSLLLGGAAALVVSLVTIAWSVRVLGKVAPSALLAGETTTSDIGTRAKPRWSGWIALIAAAGAATMLATGGYLSDHEARAVAFFGGGALLLTACLTAVSAWMRGGHGRAVAGHGWLGIARLGIRNAARHPTRSLLTAGLLAAASFLVVAVEAFRRTADAGDASPGSASGGFSLLAESDLPVYLDLNGDKGHDEVGALLLPKYRDGLGGDNAAAERRVADSLALLRETKIYAFRVHGGDDASCLNLYQPRRPRVLGVPRGLIERGGFRFAAVDAGNDAQRRQPWILLDSDRGRSVPAFGENNTVVWQLNKGLGKDIEAPGAALDEPLRIAGLLQDSVFQSGLLVSERNFLRLYPGQEGYNFLLIEPPTGRAADVKALLEMALADRGFEVTPTAARLESYLAVENTYLSTFQALGGLGLVLGSLGLGVVLLRGVWERRAELALFRALGYRRSALGWLVLAENGFLLLLGLGAGTGSALLAVAPHLAEGAATVPWRELAVLLTGALAVGLIAGTAATAATLRAPLVPALRRE